MSDKTGIQWTDSTWNPVVGCSLVSPGCTNCYAMKVANRLLDKPGSHYEGTTKRVNGNAVWTGKLNLAPEHILTQPLRWKCPRKIFVNSMSDLFHESVPDEWIDKVFAVMAMAPQHTFQVLTKRPERMRKWFNDELSPYFYACTRIEKLAQELASTYDIPQLDVQTEWPLPNVWLGVSAEDQKRADERIPALLDIPAHIHFLSIEPLLERVIINPLFMPAKVKTPQGIYKYVGHQIRWIVVGGESGPGARPMHIDWARSLRDQCIAAGVAFHFKQFGEFRPAAPVYPEEDKVWQQCWIDEHHPGDKAEDWDLSAEDAFDFMKDFPDLGVMYRGGHFYSGEEWQPHVNSGCWWMERVGKKAAGRLLDGREWNEFPEAAA